MRRLLFVVPFVLLPRLALATPFTPNRFVLTVSSIGQPINTCINCADADPLNDFHLSVGLGGGSGAFPPNNQGAAGLGQLSAIGPFPSTVEFVPLLFTATLDLWDSAFPDLHSITTGDIRGGVSVGAGSGLLMCCTGSLNTASVGTPSGLYNFSPTFPVVSFVLTLDRPTNPVFTPAEAPEPSSLLLLGSGLLALRRRAVHLA
jgi:hypothetical protein